ncbi:MAG: nickel-dependent lactate racemase [Lachnospiraceae bacterium]|nr:nickel-dependent lactate racemase [Lachnospiraceae bacterium]
MKIEIPYGMTKQMMEIGEEAEVLTASVFQNINNKNPEELVRQAMNEPIGSRPLYELARGKKTAVVIISDHTRPVPSKYLIPFMLEELRRDNPDIAITLLVATGCHRGTKREELEAKLGKSVMEKENIIVHDCIQSPCIHLGKLPSGADLEVNSLVVQADLVIAEGFVEPHFFAGFSGGRKSILPGVCSRKTVLGNHCAAFIRHPLARMGILEGNPINRDMEAAVSMAGLAYIVNVILDEEKQIQAVFAGDPILAHHAGCRYLERYCRVTLQQKGDIVITSNGGDPLDQNVYQTVKCMATAELASRPAGVIIVCARCQDGIGGEAFFYALKECSSARQLLEDTNKLSMEETKPDQWQYQILARILSRHTVILVTEPEWEEAVRAMKMEYASSLKAAYEMAKRRKGDAAKVVVIPDGVSVIVAAGD